MYLLKKFFNFSHKIFVYYFILLQHFNESAIIKLSHSKFHVPRIERNIIIGSRHILLQIRLLDFGIQASSTLYIPHRLPFVEIL